MFVLSIFVCCDVILAVSTCFLEVCSPAVVAECRIEII
jgi:hypothetical protein